jgi:hypothetical protein
MVAPFMAPFCWVVKTSTGTPWDTKKQKNPSRINDLGFFLGMAWDGLKPRYMWSIIT